MPNTEGTTSEKDDGDKPDTTAPTVDGLFEDLEPFESYTTALTRLFRPVVLHLERP